MKLLSIIAIIFLLVTWKTVDRLPVSMRDNFSRSAKKLAAEKALKINYYNLCTTMNVHRKYQRKQDILIWNWDKTK